MECHYSPHPCNTHILDADLTDGSVSVPGPGGVCRSRPIHRRGRPLTGGGGDMIGDHDGHDGMIET